MKSPPDFDGDPATFRAPPRTANVDHSRRLRWRVDPGRLVPLPAGSPAGEVALAAEDADSAERQLALVAEG
jgi:hypothetical protein